MKWTTEYPTKPGFYWLRNYEVKNEPVLWRGPMLVEVEKGDYWHFHGLNGTWRRWDIVSAEWYGPIKPPE
jgi:hypothetical protein